jgi:hypothetical protein
MIVTNVVSEFYVEKKSVLVRVYQKNQNENLSRRFLKVVYNGLQLQEVSDFY